MTTVVLLKKQMRFLAFFITVPLIGLGIATELVAESPQWTATRPAEIRFSSEGTAEILCDSSVQLAGDIRWQEFTLYFRFPTAKQVQDIRVELLPAKAITELNRQHRNKRLVLFDIKPDLENGQNEPTPLEFSSCVYAGNPDDESTANCIDFLTDTGWTVPAFTEDAPSHELTLRFAQPVKLNPGSRFALTFDSGGSPELDVLSRLRVSFLARRDCQPD